jgi:hypothetical protein
LNINYVEIASGGVKDQSAINFSSSKSFSISPQINILVNRSLDITKLSDGCPAIKLFFFDESKDRWTEVPYNKQPMRYKSIDTADACGYTLETEHFSKFAVGGIRPLSEQL